jgi:tRNA dimethylallyltransferase
MRPKIVIILGATAVGKSAVALRLAEIVNGEIVNADSQQVYRHMDIGTGKPSKADRERVQHHLIDIVAPNEEFNAALFRRLATDSIRQIHARERKVIVCGGTGLYLRALTHGLFEGPGQDPDVRNSLEQEIANSGLGILYERLEKIDPTVGATIHRNDRQRIIRALEVYQLTGRPLSAWQKEHGFQEDPFDILKIGLLRERAELYDLINLRSERIIEDGLLEEVRGLVKRGFDLDLKPLRSVGYRQMGQVLRGTQSMDDAVEEMKQETRRLAKRQLTWFRRDEEICWFHPEKQYQEIVFAVATFLS